MSIFVFFLFFFFNDTATTEIYTLSLHDALPISWRRPSAVAAWRVIPVMTSGTVIPKKVQAMWAHRRKDAIGEVPGLRSVATAIGKPCRRKASTGGGRVSFRT